MEIFMYSVTLTLKKKEKKERKKKITKRVHGNLVVHVTVIYFFLAMVHGYFHVRNITVQ